MTAGLPRALSLEAVAKSIREARGVEDVHDLHVWSLGEETQALSCHIRIPELDTTAGEAILAGINAVLEKRFSIRYTTIQIEEAVCDATERCAIH